MTPPPIQPTITPEARFGYVALSDEQKQRVEALRTQYALLCELVEAAMPPGRERALAITDLESSCMWAIKGVSRSG